MSSLRQTALTSGITRDKINVNSPFPDVVAYGQGRLRDLTRPQFQQSVENFKKYDLNGDGFLDVHDVAKMMEKLGVTKTVTECRQMITDIDKDGDGRISFVEFLEMLVPRPAELGASMDNLGKTTGSQVNLSEFKKIYTSNLSNHAQFFESKVAALKDTTSENREQIKKEYEEKKKAKAIRDAELQKEREEKEAQERAREESRNRLAARAAMFAEK